jgi:type IX secretion system PorP/SprF family membrane protein
MNRINCFISIVAALVVGLQGRAQSDQHYTMFMYNKLLYNPGYTGSGDYVTINTTYRRQWIDIPNTPRLINMSVDGPLGTYMRPFRKLAVGFSMSHDRQGVERNNNLRAYCAYRIQLKKSVISFGLSGGTAFYNAYYRDLRIGQPYDPSFTTTLENVVLPNFGAGAYWRSKEAYCGLSVPNMLQNYYDKDLGRRTAKQIRAYYLSGGYSFTAGEDFRIQPQALVRYAMNGASSLPLNADINLSAIAYNRLLLGLTYRTDGSIEGIMHIQVSRRFNMGYAYDHMVSALGGYAGGTHEVVLGYDLVRDNFKFLTPRFIRKF